jgi:hypothetical protein
MNRVLVGILLLIGGLLGLFMTACGGIFSVGMLSDAGSKPYRGVLVMSLPSFFAGLLLLWFVWRQFTRFRNAGAAPHQSTPSPSPLSPSPASPPTPMPPQE